MPLADSHVHLFAGGIVGRYGRACSGGHDLETYESFRAEHGIDVALVVGYEGEPEYRGNNGYVADLAADNGWMVPLAFTPTDAPAVPSRPFAGISLYLSTPEDGRRFAGWPPEVLHGLSAEEMIVSVNAVPATLAPAVETIRALDRCRVLISHVGEPGAHREPPTHEQVSAALEPVLSLSAARHVGVKLSALYALSNPAHAYPHAAARPVIERVAEAFGTERLYWGSDFSPALDFVSFAQTVSAIADLPWSDSERTAIMGGNLRRLVKRSAPAAA
jgi:L-fuconolactonase